MTVELNNIEQFKKDIRKSVISGIIAVSVGVVIFLISFPQIVNMGDYPQNHLFGLGLVTIYGSIYPFSLAISNSIRIKHENKPLEKLNEQELEDEESKLKMTVSRFKGAYFLTFASAGLFLFYMYSTNADYYLREGGDVLERGLAWLPFVLLLMLTIIIEILKKPFVFRSEDIKRMLGKDLEIKDMSDTV